MEIELSIGGAEHLCAFTIRNLEEVGARIENCGDVREGEPEHA